ncbi:receptor-type guanylate cyclase Gyc76C-like isoform X2 [Macrosteles quadrilineatus]|uniref:receptor-type guanylate cyclase Gyc76C-like isoform X2 n=1 Tax=Macrosteles quadrilineatus TaxID=74068 RepID=UPI0023E292AA|nr:receptor-type guanylate cyclase Gyc76C-like isoform X2 [Macrosteles quadrilineatus]XP_054274446.1 receptor-type guanylate cyclase Gyc76C-like isoform X2 [Macrosteles quadrilineatus]
MQAGPLTLFVHLLLLTSACVASHTTVTLAVAPSTTAASTTVAPPTPPPHINKNLTIGYLTAIRGDLRDRQGLLVSGAIQMAVDKVNSDPSLLPNVTLVLKWQDMRGDTVISTRLITEMICEGIYAFFGPEGSCYVEAIVSQSRNIPMLSYKCSDHRASAVPTFVRTEPPDTQVTKSVIALLKYYDWKKFCIIWEDDWEIVAESLHKEANQANMTVTCVRPIQSSAKCCRDLLPCCTSGFWYNMLIETRNLTRIYVFFGQSKTLVDMMENMDALQLFDNGEYMVIFVDLTTYSIKEASKYFWRIENPKSGKTLVSCSEEMNYLRRAQSLLVVVPSPPAETYEEFSDKVREYNAQPPFNFPTPPVFTTSDMSKFISVTAANLYDAVLLYARALDKLLKEEPVLNETVVEQVATNGTRIIETIIKNRTYESITGATNKLDLNGDSEGNFSVVAFKKFYHYIKMPTYNFTCDYNFIPVGQFFQGDTLPEYKLNSPSLQPDWVGGRKPDDEPSCGFHNELCAKDDSQESGVIIAMALGILLFCSSVFTLSMYRKWRIEQEIEGLLWKIDLADLLSYYNNDIVSSPSKTSLVSATSIESRCGGQVFAATGQYRGVVVRIKELKFSKKKDITRETMKEMRRLREIRHDNINSFIGASVEPMRILIITDYCAKGSLYDIVENEDIKLDKMFIASLVNDLIKGMLYLHTSANMPHGNLKSSNCVVTSRWVLQVTDFGLHEMRQCAENDSIGEHQYYRNLLWKAPELLRDPHAPVDGTLKGDVYAFAIIMHEIIGRRGPFGACGFDEPSEIIKMVRQVPGPGEAPFRPNLEQLRDSEAGQDYVLAVIQECWAEQPELRPDFRTIRASLKNMREGKQKNIMDQMMDMMEKYANNLEDLVNQRTLEVYEEKRKTEDLLHRMLPAPVAARLTRGFGVEPESFDLVTIYFSDIVGFTQMSAESTPLQVVNFLNDLYTLFDRIIKGYDVYKVETIGDAYMVVSGLPIRNGDKHVGEIASMSLDLLEAVKNYQIAHRPHDTLQLRIGVHTGPVVAGVVGLTMPRYCLFGDTVNTASRMESNGLPLKIHISPQCRQALIKIGGYTMEERGVVHMKGKGDVLTYWLTGVTEGAIRRREVNVDELPPLFCRPHRSPKQMGEDRRLERRQSSVPRGNSEDRGVPNNFPGPLRRLVRESHSLDPFPDKRLEKIGTVKRSLLSLQENNLMTCNGPNGERVVGNGGLVCDPLLDHKRWHSLEDMPLDNVSASKKIITRSSIRSWLFGLFNNNGCRSDLNLRKNCTYTEMQAEKESIV